MKNKIKQLFTKQGHLIKSRIYNKELYSKIDILDIYEQIKDLDFNSASKILYDLYYPEKANRKCPICDNPVEFISFSCGYKNTCSKKCTNILRLQKIKETNLKKYGVENVYQSTKVKEKIKKTNLEKYGCENPMQSKDIQEKTKKTNLKRYGFESHLLNKDIQEKIKQTNLKKYGVENPFQAEKIKEKIKQTNLKKYGVENPIQSEEIKEKIKQTNLKKYGTESHLKSNQIKKKIKETNLKKYGVENVFAAQEIKEKIKQTNLKRYGVKYSLQSKKIQKKSKQTNLKKYGVENPIQSEEIKEKVKETNLKRYGTEFTSQKSIKNYDEYINLTKEDLEKFIDERGYFKIDTFCNHFNLSYSYTNKIKIKLNCTAPNKSNRKKLQKEIFEFIRQYDPEVKFDDRNIISPLEIDILSDKYKFGIEFNGLMFHSFGISKHSMFNNADEESILKKHHLKKTELLESKGYQLFHIFENEWIDPIKRDIWKSVLASKMGITERIYARKCTIKEVQPKEARKFLENNHLQGYIPGKIKIGLYYNDELVQICTFSKPRMTKKYEWELIRMCSKKFYTIIGGASKLLKYFERNYLPKNIVSYGNRRWSFGNVYQKTGFSLQNISGPNYFYFNENEYILYSRNKFQKHKLKTLLEDFNPDLTETENMYLHGYRKIYDCGNLVYSRSF